VLFGQVVDRVGNWVINGRINSNGIVKEYRKYIIPTTHNLENSKSRKTQNAKKVVGVEWGKK
jgi:hypothetical protein